MTQKVYREDIVLEALRDLGGEALVSEIVAIADGEIGSIGALVTLGQLHNKKVEKVEERSMRGNPCFRIIGYRDPDKEPIRDRWAPR